MTTPNPIEQLHAIKEQAKRFGMFLVLGPTTKGTTYKLFRHGFPRSAYLGRRTSLRGIGELVSKCAGGRS